MLGAFPCGASYFGQAPSSEQPSASGGYFVWPPEAVPLPLPPVRKVGGSTAVVEISAAGKGHRRARGGSSVRIPITARAGGRLQKRPDDRQVFAALEALDAFADEEREIEIIEAVPPKPGRRP